MKTDAQIRDICSQLLFVHHETEVLVDHDHDAPDEGPNHERHKALLAEYATLAEALTKAAPPRTLKGIRGLAELAMTLAVRTDEERLSDPKDFADWLWLFALTSAAGIPEAIPLPENLPVYWPAEVR